VLVLNLLRWEADIRDHAGLGIPDDGVKGAGVAPAEMKMALQLVDSMGGEFRPEKFEDRFRGQVMELVARRARAGKTEEVVEPEEELPRGADIIDLTDLLRRSLGGGRAGRGAGAGAKASRRPPSRSRAGARGGGRRRAA